MLCYCVKSVTRTDFVLRYLSFSIEMEGEDSSFPQDSSDDISQRGSVASSATLCRGMAQQISVEPTEVKNSPPSVSVLLKLLKWHLPIHIYIRFKSSVISVWRIWLYFKKYLRFCPAQDVLVYLFGESAVHLTIEGLGSVNVQDLGRNVREALHIAESAQDAFAFWLCSPLLGRNIFSHAHEYYNSAGKKKNLWETCDVLIYDSLLKMPHPAYKWDH